MTEQEATLTHLTLHKQGEKEVVVSGFMAALRDARGATLRDPDTGQKRPNVNHGNWLGAIGYLIVLDHIGTCFKPKASSRLTDQRGIVKALQYFDKLTELEILAIYALRCTFAHNYPLCNLHWDSRLQHHFVVCVGPSPVVTLPKEPWGGDFGDFVKNQQRATWINLEAMGDLVEGLYTFT
jgi:hypothetical protein